MPAMAIKLDVDGAGGFDAVKKSGADRVVHLDGEQTIEVGTLRHGMLSGKDSCAFCFALPDGSVVIAETSVELFVATARAITAWQEGRKERGED